MPMKTTNLRRKKNRGSKGRHQRRGKKTKRNVGESVEENLGLKKKNGELGDRVMIGNYGVPIEISLNTTQNASFMDYLV